MASLANAILRFGDNVQETVRKNLVRKADVLIAETEREAVARSGIAPTHEIYVDGHKAASARGAQNVIVIEFGYTREVAKTAIIEWIKRAPGPNSKHPFQLGAAGGFIPFVNGQRINDLKQIPHNAEVFLVSTVDYARRLEVGRTKDGSVFSVKGHGLAETLAKRVLNRRYGKMANITFAYTELDPAYVLKGRMTGTRYTDKHGNSRKRYGGLGKGAGEAVKYPTIVIGRRLA